MLKRLKTLEIVLALCYSNTINRATEINGAEVNPLSTRLAKSLIGQDSFIYLWQLNKGCLLRHQLRSPCGAVDVVSSKSFGLEKKVGSPCRGYNKWESQNDRFYKRGLLKTHLPLQNKSGIKIHKKNPI